MNLQAFRLINNLANQNIVLDKIMIFFSNDVPYIFMGAIALVFIIGIAQRNPDYRKIAFSTFFITVINLVINLAIRSIFPVARPFVYNRVNLLVPHDTASSFPSNHAAGTMSIALGLEKFSRPISIILTILSIIVGFSRVYVGNHYPADIIGAYIIVYATTYIYNTRFRSKIENLYGAVEKKASALLRVRTTSDYK
jgi:undecaprenyl-diphosphatase